MKVIDKIRADELVERFRVLVVGSNGSGKSSLIRYLVDKQNHTISLEDIEFKLYDNNGRKIIIEYYEHFFNKLDKNQKQFFLTKCNLVIVVIDLSRERNASTLKETITELNELIQLPFFMAPRMYIKGVDKSAEFKRIPTKNALLKTIIVLNKYDNFLVKKSISEIDLVEYIKSSYLPEDILFTSVTSQINLEKLKKRIFAILFNEISESHLLTIKFNLNKFKNLVFDLLRIHSIGKNHLIDFFEKIRELAFNSQDHNIRIASFWALGELNNREIIGELKNRYRRYPDGWDEEKFEMMIALLKLGEEPFSPEKTKQLLLKDYVLSYQKDLLNLNLKERGIYYTPMDNPKKIFIAFVEEELRRARNLYKKLEEAGHKPWMYTEDGKGGSYWKEEIDRVIKDSDYVIATFSKRSEEKDGYFNTEIRKAMEITHTKASGKRFLIPIKFEECKIPVMKVETLYLHDLNWIDYYRKNSYKKLLEAIELD